MLPDYLLLPWLGVVALVGAGFNLWLIRYLGARATSQSWKLAIVVGLISHVGLVGLIINLIARLAFETPADHIEAVGYIVGLPILLFVSVPIALWVCYRPRWRGRDEGNLT